MPCDQFRYRPARFHLSLPRSATTAGRGHKAASYEILQRIGLTNRTQAGDWSPAARHQHLRAILHLTQVLAQAIVQRTHANLVRPRM